MRKSLKGARNRRLFSRGTMKGIRNPITTTLVRGGPRR